MINIAMFDNDDKEGNQPDMKGYNKDLNCSVAGWWKTASNGSRYLSLRIETAEDKQAQMQGVKNQIPASKKSGSYQHAEQDYSRQRGSDNQPQPTIDDPGFDDEIPF